MHFKKPRKRFARLYRPHRKKNENRRRIFKRRLTALHFDVVISSAD